LYSTVKFKDADCRGAEGQEKATEEILLWGNERCQIKFVQGPKYCRTPLHHLHLIIRT